jgi:hypothetical protein
MHATKPGLPRLSLNYAVPGIAFVLISLVLAGFIRGPAGLPAAIAALILILGQGFLRAWYRRRRRRALIRELAQLPAVLCQINATACQAQAALAYIVTQYGQLPAALPPGGLVPVSTARAGRIIVTHSSGGAVGGNGSSGLGGGGGGGASQPSPGGATGFGSSNTVVPAGNGGGGGWYASGGLVPAGGGGGGGYSLPAAPPGIFSSEFGSRTAQPEPDLVLGTITGYRWWTLLAPDLTLSPATAGEHWPAVPLQGMRAPWLPGVNIATCLTTCPATGHHDIPWDACGCGYWAYWLPGYHDVGLGPGQLPVMGVIRGMGRTLIGERGFRCARAEIAAVYLPFVIDPVLPPADSWQRAGFAGQVMYLGGPPVVSRPDPPDPAEIRAAADAAEAWTAVIGDRIEQMYPGVRVFETLDAMLRCFPPDPNYSPYAAG